MKIPFTIEQFLKVFKEFNLAVWPVQIILYIFALATIFFAIKRAKGSNKIVSVALSFFWLWMGIVYHLIFFTTINKAAYLFAIFFVLQGLLFFFLGFLKHKLLFNFQATLQGVTGIILIVFALIAYPILNFIFDHIYPYSPTFRLPYPTVIFTLGLLQWTKAKNTLIILLIPLFWSFVGFFAAFSLKIYEDTGLVIAGIITIITAIVKNRKIENKGGDVRYMGDQ